MVINWKRIAKIFRRRHLSQTDTWCDGWDEGHGVGRQNGAAVAFGLMGMAEAIRQRCTCPPYAARWEDACERCKGYP